MTSGLSQLFIECESSVDEKLATEFKTMLKNVSNISIKSNQREIQSNQTLFLLIKKHSRIGADIDRAVKILTDTPVHMVALVVIHIKQPHALPSVMTKYVLSDCKYNDFGLIVDMAFINGEYYDCQMNTDGRTQLKEFIKKNSNERVLPVGSNANVPIPARLMVEKYEMCTSTRTLAEVKTRPLHEPVQLYIQPGLNVDLRDTYERLGVELNLRDSVYQVDAFLHLDKDKPWIVVCEQGHFIQQQIQKVADGFDSPKCLLVLHQNEDKETSTWSANRHLLTYELPRDHFGYFLKNCVADNKDIQKFRSMLVAGRTDEQVTAAKRPKPQCYIC